MKAGGEVQIRSGTLIFNTLNHLSKVRSGKIASDFRVEFRAEGKVIFLRPSTALERLKAVLMPSQARRKANQTVENVLKEMARNNWIPQAGAELGSVRGSTAGGHSLAERALLENSVNPFL